MSKTKFAPPAGPTRKQLSRAQRDRRMRRIILGATLAVAVVVIGVIGYGILDQTVLQPRQAVARVTGVPITLGEFQKTVRYQRFLILNRRYFPLQQAAQFFASDPQSQQFYITQLQQVANYLADTQTLGLQVLNQLIDDELVRQEAARRGITVSAEEVEARLKGFFGYYPDGTPTPTITPSPRPTNVPPTVNPTAVARWTATPTLTPTATLEPTATATEGPAPTASPTQTPWPTATPFTADAYGTAVFSYTSILKDEAGVSAADLRRFVELEILREKLEAAITADVPAEQEQVWARHILVDDATTANLVREQLNAGLEDWTSLAANYSQDVSNAQRGGDLGWFSAGQMVPEFEAAAFNTPVGGVSEPVQTSFGWHIIQVLGREMRALSADELQQARDQAFETWLQSQRDALDDAGRPVVEIYDNWHDRVPTVPAIPGAR